MFDYRNTSFEIKEGKPTLGILPIAAIEQHGDHLPVATDLLIMNAISEGVAERLEETLFRLPVFPYGTSMSHSAFSGTLWLSADTLYSVIRDVIESLYEHGISRVVVINNHGAAGGTTIVPRGNFVAKTAVRQINYDYPEQQSIWVQPFAVAQRRLMEIFDTASNDVHAGEIETSLMLHLHPDKVAGTGTDYVAKEGVELLDFVGFDRLSASGVWGNPSRASAENGALALEAAIASTVAYINESFEHLDRAKTQESSKI